VSQPDDWVSIARATELAGVTRRTIERWAKAGKLLRVEHPTNHRTRLVHLPSVLALAEQSTGGTSNESGERLELQVPVDPHEQGSSSLPREFTGYGEVIDETLRIIYSHHHRLASRLYPDGDRPLNIDAMRSGPLGRDLRKLAALARGDIREPKEIVVERIETLLQLFFWPPMADDYVVPRAFWETQLGRMMSMAKFRAFNPEELISIPAAAARLGVNRATIYRWMDERHIGYVRDEVSGRTFVVDHDIEALLEESNEFYQKLQSSDRLPELLRK
jgi:excisionase family DNA binding protein